MRAVVPAWRIGASPVKLSRLRRAAADGSRCRLRRLLGLLICQVFAMNLVAAALLDAPAAAAASFDAMLRSARCGEAIPAADATGKLGAITDQAPRDRAPGDRHSCPLCATACPMGGCAPVGGGPSPLAAAAPMPRDFPGIGSFLDLVSAKPARLLSDAPAQAPPAPVGSHVHAVSEQS